MSIIQSKLVDLYQKYIKNGQIRLDFQLISTFMNIFDLFLIKIDFSDINWTRFNQFRRDDLI